MLHVVAVAHNIVQALLDIMFLTLTFHAFLSSADFQDIFFYYFNNNIRLSICTDPDRARRFCRA